MPAPHPRELRRRAVELARLREKPVADIANRLGDQRELSAELDEPADVDERRKEGLTSDERAELAAKPR